MLKYYSLLKLFSKEATEGYNLSAQFVPHSISLRAKIDAAEGLMVLSCRSNSCHGTFVLLYGAKGFD